MCEIAPVASTAKTLVPAMVIAVGSMAFWTLVIIAAVEHDDLLVGIALGLGAVVAVFATVVAVRRSRARRAARERILDQGTVAKARIVSARSNGALNNDPYVDFVLEVQPEGAGEPYQVVHRTLVSQLAIPRVQPDTEIDVWVDPTDRESVVIDPRFTT
jgi:hypothetical protein